MKENKGLILVLCTALISGVSIFINKFGVKAINSSVFCGMKNLVVAVFLISLILILKEWKVLRRLQRKDWLTLFVVGLVGGSVPFLLFFKGLQMTTGAEGAFIHKTLFIFVAIFALIFLKEKLHKGFIIGALCLLAGNILLLKLIHPVFEKGDLLILLATILWATENTISKYALKTLSPRIVAFGRMFFGSLLIMVFLAVTGQIHIIGTLTVSQIGWILITSAFLFGYVTTWYTGIKYARVSQATCVLALGAPITSLLSLIFLHQALSFKEIAGMALIVLGIVLVIGIARLFRRLKLTRLVHVRS